MAEHFLDQTITQTFWDNSIEPRLAIEAGDVVVFDCPEPCGQVTPEWTAEDFANLNLDLVHSLVGSIYVKGAKPGDTLQIEVIELLHKNWGWTGHSSGNGLLAEDFDFAYIHHWKLEGDRCIFGVRDIELPFEPFCGVMGVAPREPGRIDTIPPRSNGGNVDIRHLVPGSTVWLPVFVEGALFACGDCHSAQGSGEVCGTAIESPMLATLQLTVRNDISVNELQFQTPSPLTKVDTKGYHVTTAYGPDLMENAKNAIRALIDWLVDNHGLTRSQAYVLCSAAADLMISEIVDAPNWVISAYMPLSIFKT